MGVTFKEQGKLDEAIEALNKALSIKPDYAEAYNNIGVTFKEQGKLDEAIEAYNKALSIKPDYADAYNNIGVTFKEQGKLDEAIEALNNALSIRPDYAEAWTNGAEVLEKWNKLEELEIWLNKAFDLFETVPADLRFMKSTLLWRNKSLKKPLLYSSILNLKLFPKFGSKAICNSKQNALKNPRNLKKLTGALLKAIHWQKSLMHIQCAIMLKIIFKI